MIRFGYGVLLGKSLLAETMQTRKCFHCNSNSFICSPTQAQQGPRFANKSGPVTLALSMWGDRGVLFQP